MPKVLKKTATKAAPAPAPAAKPAPKPAPKPAAPVAKPTPAAPTRGPAPKNAGKAKGEEHGTKDIASILDQMDDTWANSEEKSGFEKIPAGKYQVRIDKWELGHSQNGRFQCTFHLTIAGGEFVNRKLWKRDGLDNEDSIGWFKSGLTRLGIESPKSMKQLPEVLSQLDGTYAEVTVKHQADSDFTNVYFNKALDSGEVDTGDLETVDTDGDAGEAAEVKTFAVGDKVQGNFGGDWYQGVVKKVKGTTATVTFEDGETHELDFSALEPFNPDGDDAGEAGEGGGDAPFEEVEGEVEETGETEEVAETAVKFTFTEANISEALQGKIAALAQKHDFNPDDYPEWIGLLQDVAEYCGIEGTFSKPEIVVKKLESIKS